MQESLLSRMSILTISLSGSC